MEVDAALRKRGRDTVCEISPDGNRVVRRREGDWLSLASLLASAVAAMDSAAHMLPLPAAIKRRCITDYFSPRSGAGRAPSASQRQCCGRASGALAPCAFCGRSFCLSACLSACARCGLGFCGGCSTTDYRAQHPRTLCLDCAR